MANKYSKDHKKLIKADLTQEIINVDDGVQIIHKEAFDDAKAVEVTLPNGLVELEDNAFLRAHDLVKMNLPTSLKKIGNGAFQTKTGLIMRLLLHICNPLRNSSQTTRISLY